MQAAIVPTVYKWGYYQYHHAVSVQRLEYVMFSMGFFPNGNGMTPLSASESIPPEDSDRAHVCTHPWAFNFKALNESVSNQHARQKMKNLETCILWSWRKSGPAFVDWISAILSNCLRSGPAQYFTIPFRHDVEDYFVDWPQTSEQGFCVARRCAIN